MPEGAVLRGTLTATVALLVAAAAALGGSAVLGWGWIDFQVPKRGIVAVRVTGSEVLPALMPLAVLALAAVAAVLATGGWARRLLGGLLLTAAVPLIFGVLQVDEGRLTVAAMSAAGWSAGSVHAETTTMVLAGPGFAVGGVILLVGAGVALVMRGHRMPRLGRRYQAPSSRRSAPEDGLWARMDAGEDPTS